MVFKRRKGLGSIGFDVGIIAVLRLFFVGGNHLFMTRNRFMDKAPVETLSLQVLQTADGGHFRGVDPVGE